MYKLSPYKVQYYVVVIYTGAWKQIMVMTYLSILLRTVNILTKFDYQSYTKTKVSVRGVPSPTLAFETKRISRQRELKKILIKIGTQFHEEMITTNLGRLVYLAGQQICNTRVTIDVISS